MTNGPSPDAIHPINGIDRTVFLKPVVRDPQMIVGDYSYYDDPDDPKGFERTSSICSALSATG